MKSWTFLIPGLFGISSALASAPQTPLRPLELQFQYESHDGDWTRPCKSALSGEVSPYDYTVKCYDGATFVRKFDVHLALTTYQRAEAPKTSIEVLYWVNGEGATSWVHLDQVSQMSEFESSQSIAGEPASLRMKVRLK